MDAKTAPVQEPAWKEEVRAWLNSARWFNEGHGLMLPPSLAAYLKENGITGPYCVSRPLPLK